MTEEHTPQWLRPHLDDLERDIAPPHDLWPGIRTRLHRPPSPRRWVLATAAGLAIASASALITWQALRPADGPAPGHASPVADWLQPYEHARTLQRVHWAETRDQLDPDLVAVIERNLAIIHAATAELVEALNEAPQDARTRALLDRTLARELALYRHVSQLAIDPRVRTHAL